MAKNGIIIVPYKLTRFPLDLGFAEGLVGYQDQMFAKKSLNLRKTMLSKNQPFDDASKLLK